MSWALRSFLTSRPHNLLPRLRPVGRRVIHATTFLGRSNLIAPRGYASNSSCGNLHAEVKRHLYVVLDDHKDGYTIHKLDLDDDLDSRLPKPPLLRVALTTVTEHAQFAGVGSSIVAIGGSLNIDCWSDHCDVRLFLAYDTETAEMEVTNHGLREVNHKAAVAVGGGLYVLDSAHEPVWTWYQRNGGAHLRRPTRRSLMFDNGWSSWEPLSYYSRWSCKQHCWNDVTPPFLTNQITAYAAAAHAPAQNEHEIFVSVRASFDGEGNQLGAGTFSFSTASLEWTRRGQWQMPVQGLAHHDEGLDTCVGLHAVHGTVTVTDGRLCAGQITAAPTEWKVGGEKLFRLDEDLAAGWRHLDAKLVPMTPHVGGGDYCLMERLVPSKGAKDDECLGDGDDKNKFFCEWLPEEEECLLRLTAFRVERGHDGEPVATARRAARSYRLCRYNKFFDAQAFWM